MPGTAGKKTRVKTSATQGGVYSDIQGIKSVNTSLDAAMVDDSEFGVDWNQRLQALKDFKVSLAGNRRLADANGQNALLTAYINGTPIWIHVLPDNGTTVGVGFEAEMYVTKFAGDTAVDGAGGISIDLEATGAVALI